MIHPNDHKSELKLYGRFQHTYGDKQYGVPTKVLALVLSKTLEIPKSPIFSVLLLVRNTFADFKSRCNTFFECRALTPNNSCMNQLTITLQSNNSPFFFQFLRKVCKSPSTLFQKHTFTVLHDNDEGVLKMVTLLVLYNEGDVEVIELFEYFNLDQIIKILNPRPTQYPSRPYLIASFFWRHRRPHPICF